MARFDTITGEAWKRAMRKARERRKGTSQRMAKAIRLAGVATKRHQGNSAQ